MADPRFARRTVRARRPHPCWWCPDDIPAGTVCEVWAVAPGGLITRGYAHLVCEADMCDKLAESLGDADGSVCFPDRDCMLRTLSFMDSPEDVRTYVAHNYFAHEADRLIALWPEARARFAARLEVPRG